MNTRRQLRPLVVALSLLLLPLCAGMGCAPCADSCHRLFARWFDAVGEPDRSDTSTEVVVEPAPSRPGGPLRAITDLFVANDPPPHALPLRI